MNLWQSYNPGDSPQLDDGDVSFIGINERLAPPQLPPGYLSQGKNTRCRNGKAHTRQGQAICRWLKTDGLTPFTEIYGAGIFTDPISGQEWILIAADGGVWKTQPHNIATAVPMPSDVTLTAATFKQFVQCFNVVVLLRGDDDAPLVCRNGIAAGFESVPAAVSASYNNMPNSGFGLFYANRLLAISGRDELAVSLVQDYTSYVPALSQFKINTGNNDSLVAVVPFTASTLIMLKDQSVLRIDNATDTVNAVLSNVTNKYGCVAPRSVVDYGTDLAWFSERGIVTLRLTEQNEIQGTDQCLSDDISETMKRINWLYASGIVAESYDSKLFFAVPLDDARLLGPELIPSTATYAYLSPYSISGVTVGRTYQYTQGASDVSLVDNGPTYMYGSCIFTATNDTIAAYTASATSTSVTASLKEVLSTGVNNAILVYDTLNSAWVSAPDERAGMAIKSWVKFTYNGKIRLGYVSNDGWLYIIEEGYNDETLQTVITPYIDVVALHNPTSGNPIGSSDTIRVNGGTLIASNSSGSVNSAGGFVGVQSASTTQIFYAGRNLWSDGSTAFGFKPTLASAWTCPNCTPTQIADGVRFTATNGTLPTVTVTYDPTSTVFWAFTQEYSGNMIMPLEITTTIITRGYSANRVDKKRMTHMALLCSTWNPTYSISSIDNGVSTEATWQTAVTRSRTAYSDYAFNQSAFDETNPSDTFAARGRQDYSIILPDLGLNLGASGVTSDLHQDSIIPVAINQHAYWTQIKVVNTQGRFELRASMMTGQEDFNVVNTSAG